ncbi:S41 family peptidase [Planctomycetota bacterium]|nr:S41 family peptidase [Planctomycetota bacterium]
MSRSILSLLALMLLTLPTIAQEAPNKNGFEERKAQAQANVKVLDSVIATIQARFYDKTYGGHDLAAMRKRFLQRVERSQPGVELHSVLRKMLGEFKVSHLSVIEKEAYDVHFVPEMNDSKTLQTGIELTEYNNGLFVSNVLHGSTGDVAGIKRGDRIVRINGTDAAESDLLLDAGGDPGLPGKAHFFIRCVDDKAIGFHIERTAGMVMGPISVMPGKYSMIEASRNSVKVIEHEGKKLGYIRFWHFLHGGMTDALKKALNGEFKECDGLIVDLRGRGGSPMVMNACFAPFGDPPPMSSFPGMPPQKRNYRMPKWNKPVICLQDGGSRSAKEVYAHNWKWLNIGPIVGESSPGAVLGSTFSPLPDGSQMIIPVQRASSLMYGGTVLEANPVTPTHPIKDIVRFANGADIIKEAGIKVLMQEIATADD